jgi:hypothetical protein
MTQAELGELVPCDKATVSRIEAGLTVPDAHFAAVCDRAFLQAGGWFSRFWADSQTWESTFPAQFRAFAEYEAEATSLWLFEHSLIPGLLQTEAYAHAVLSRHPHVTDAMVTERVVARLARQSVLDRDDPPVVYVLLDENALRREVGGTKIMSEQIGHLAAMAARPKITVQLLPATGAHPGLSGSVALAETPDAQVVHLEGFTGGVTTDSPVTVAEAVSRLDTLRADAYRRADSLLMIEKAAEQWEIGERAATAGRTEGTA